MSDNEERQTEILMGMWAEMKGLNGRVDKTNAALAELREETHDGFTRLDARIDKLTEETHAGFADVRGELAELRGEVAGTNRRIDRLGDIAGDHVRELAVRVARLEVHVGLK